MCSKKLPRTIPVWYSGLRLTTGLAIVAWNPQYSTETEIKCDFVHITSWDIKMASFVCACALSLPLSLSLCLSRSPSLFLTLSFPLYLSPSLQANLIKYYVSMHPALDLSSLHAQPDELNQVCMHNLVRYYACMQTDLVNQVCLQNVIQLIKHACSKWLYTMHLCMHRLTNQVCSQHLIKLIKSAHTHCD